MLGPYSQADAFTPGKLQRLAEYAEEMHAMSPAGDLASVGTGRGRGLIDLRTNPQPLIARAKIVAAVDGQKGRYKGKLFVEGEEKYFLDDPSGDFSEDNLGEESHTVDCEVWNPLEARGRVRPLVVGDVYSVELLFFRKSDDKYVACVLSGPIPIEFDAKITCYTRFADGRWKYGFQEQTRDGDDWTDKPNGRTGDGCNTYALNSIEANNDDESTGLTGNSVNHDEHDAGYILPVRGKPVVRIRVEYVPADSSSVEPSSEADPSLKPVYTFSYENAESKHAADTGTCACDSGQSPSSPSSLSSQSSQSSESQSSQSSPSSPSSESNLVCVFSWTCTYTCGSGWGAVTNNGANCREPIESNGWSHSATAHDGDSVTYIYYQNGSACPNPEAECNDRPEPPDAPNFTPDELDCPSSEHPSDEHARCVHTWAADWDCVSKTWNVTDTGVQCIPPPAIYGSWVKTDDLGCSYVYSAIGAECDSPGECTETYTTPAAPNVDTSKCCPSSSGGSSGSEKNNAIVPSRLAPSGFVALATTESPNVRFEDFLSATITSTETFLDLDPQFVEVCEPGTIRVAAATPSEPVFIGASVVGNKVRIKTTTTDPVDVTVHVTAIRRGFAKWRFEAKTRAEFEANERFINGWKK